MKTEIHGERTIEMIGVKVKRFWFGVDYLTWCIGFQIHYVEEYGNIIEINVLPLKAYVRVGG